MLDAIYDTALDPTRWDDVMEMLGEEFHASPTRATRVDGKLTMVSFPDLDAQTAASYMETHVVRDFLRSCVDKAGPGQIAVLHDISKDLRFKGSNYYKDFLERIHCEHFVATRIGDGGRQMSIAFRRPSGEALFSGEEVEALRDLRSHLSRALRLREILEQAEGKLLDDRSAQRDSLVIVNSDMTVRSVSERAEERMRDSDFPFLTSAGLLQADGSAGQHALRALMGQAGGAAVSTFHAHGVCYEVEAVPLTDEMSAATQHHFGSGIALLVGAGRHAETKHPVSDGEVARLRPTHAEVEILNHLSKGLTLREIGEHRGTAYETVRSQVKGLLRKSGFRNQKQLVHYWTRAEAASHSL